MMHAAALSPLQGGAPMPSWYDIESLGGHRKLEKCAGIEDSVKRVRVLMQREVDAGVPLDRVVLAGFSQGGAMSIYTGLNTPETLAGIVVMSGYMPLPDKIAPTAAALATPVFQGHGDEVRRLAAGGGAALGGHPSRCAWPSRWTPGRGVLGRPRQHHVTAARVNIVPVGRVCVLVDCVQDMVVRLDWAEDARDRMKALGVKSLAFKVYEGLPHSVALEELRDVVAFLRKVLPAEVPAKPAASSTNSSSSSGTTAAVEVAASGATAVAAATGGSGSA